MVVVTCGVGFCGSDADPGDCAKLEGDWDLDAISMMRHKAEDRGRGYGSDWDLDAISMMRHKAEERGRGDLDEGER